MYFRDRRDAGRQLAEKLTAYAGHNDVQVLALPRGGVPVAYEVARALNAPLDVFLVRKLGVPGHEELAMGALASGGIVVLDDRVIRMVHPSASAVERVREREAKELERREHEYRDDLPPPELRGRIVIVIDDGLATGSTMRAAVTALRRCGPAKIVIAVPVGAAESCASLAELADEIVCIAMPDPFHAVGAYYQDFSQTTDQEVCEFLQRDTPIPA